MNDEDEHDEENENDYDYDYDDHDNTNVDADAAAEEYDDDGADDVDDVVADDFDDADDGYNDNGVYDNVRRSQTLATGCVEVDHTLSCAGNTHWLGAVQVQ